MKKRIALLAGGLFSGLTVWPALVFGEDRQGQSPLPEYDALIADILSIDIAAIPLWRIFAAAVILMVGILVRTTLLAKILRPLEILARKTRTEVDDHLIQAVKRPMGWVLNLVAIYFAVLMLQVPETLHRTTVLILQTMGTVFVAWMVFNVVDAIGAYLSEIAKKTESQIDDHLVPLVKRVLRIAVVTVTIITIIQQWGYDVTSLIAGLGIGGLAFALAAQSTLSNWFGSVMILTDRPFSVGDLVRSTHGSGIVEDIGMRSTKIRTFQGTVITVPNSDIATTPVENINAYETMNIRAEIGLMYSTPRKKIERIIARIREMLKEADAVDSERVLVCFHGFGPSSLDILVHCFVQTSNWWNWHLEKEKLLLEIFSIVEEEGASFAFPSQSIYFENELRMARKAGEEAKSLSDPEASSAGVEVQSS